MLHSLPLKFEHCFCVFFQLSLLDQDYIFIFGIMEFDTYVERDKYSIEVNMIKLIYPEFDFFLSPKLKKTFIVFTLCFCSYVIIFTSLAESMFIKIDDFNRYQFVDKDIEEITVTLDGQDLWMKTRDLNGKDKDGGSFPIEFF